MSDTQKSLGQIRKKTNPLDWWKLQASSYPVLAKLAKKYMYTQTSGGATDTNPAFFFHVQLTAMEWVVHLMTHRKNSPVQCLPN